MFISESVKSKISNIEKCEGNFLSSEKIDEDFGFNNELVQLMDSNGEISEDKVVNENIAFNVAMCFAPNMQIIKDEMEQSDNRLDKIADDKNYYNTDNENVVTKLLEEIKNTDKALVENKAENKTENRTENKIESKIETNIESKTENKIENKIKGSNLSDNILPVINENDISSIEEKKALIKVPSIENKDISIQKLMTENKDTTFHTIETEKTKHIENEIIRTITEETDRKFESDNKSKESKYVRTDINAPIIEYVNNLKSTKRKETGEDEYQLFENKASEKYHINKIFLSEISYEVSEYKNNENFIKSSIEPVQMIDDNVFEKSLIHSIKETYDNNTIKEITIKLKPDDYGTMTVKLYKNNDNISAKITTNNPIMESLLSAHSNNLIEKLSQQGIDIHEIDISLTGYGNHFGNEPNNRNRNRNDSDGNEKIILPDKRSEKAFLTEKVKASVKIKEGLSILA